MKQTTKTSVRSGGWTSDSHRILETASSLDHYNRWIISHFDQFISGDVLEVGAGTGGLARHLGNSLKLTLSDLRDDYLLLLKKKYQCEVLKLDIENESPRKLSSKFNAIISSNVFEHIKDDQAAFSHTYDILKPGGHLCLFVPARMEIYGKLDRDMGHCRRYTVEEVSTKANKAGYKIISCRYANFLGYFLWWGRGVFLEKFIKSNAGENNADGIFAKIFDNLITPFLYLEKYIPPTIGQSVILIASKP